MSTKKGVVTAVDIERSSCRVLTDNMQFLSDVTWKGSAGGTSGYGDSNTPQEMDQVYITQMDNKWVIDGFIQAQYSGGLKRPGVSKASGERSELMDLTTLKPKSIRTNPAIPTDTRVGDRVFTTEGGGRLGVLRAGTIVAKAGPLAQLIISPYGDTARLISRNYEHFTDLDSTYKVSSRGQLYSLHEVFRTTGDSRSQRPSFTEYFGNVGVGESLGRSPMVKNKSTHGTTVSGAGADLGIVRKTSTYDAANELTSFEEEYITGRLHRFVQKGASKTESDQTLNKVSVKVHGGDTSYYNMDETSIHLDVASTVKIDITKSGIVLNSNGNAVLHIDASGAVSLQCKNIDVTCDNVGVNSKSVDWTASAVTWNVSGAFTVNASAINLG